MIARALLRHGVVLAKIAKIDGAGESPEELLWVREVIWVADSTDTRISAH